MPKWLSCGVGWLAVWCGFRSMAEVASNAREERKRKETVMNLGYISAIIAITAVLIFFILTFVAPGFPAWMVFIAAGLGIVIAGAVKSRQK